MRNGIFLFFSILVMVLAGIWLAFFRRGGAELVLVLLSVALSVITMLLLFMYDRREKRQKGGRK